MLDEHPNRAVIAAGYFKLSGGHNLTLAKEAALTSPAHPAAYLCRTPGMPLAVRRQELVLAARQRGWPAPAVYCEQESAEDGPALHQLEAAIAAGRHDALLMAAPANPAPLMRLLSNCTKLGVIVSFLPPAGQADREPAAMVPFKAPQHARETWDILARARLEALAGLFPDWRIWLDSHGWHGRRRAEGYLQGYRPGAPAFCVHAGTATDLAAQLCWQQAADTHAPEGCHASNLPPPPWNARLEVGV